MQKFTMTLFFLFAFNTTLFAQHEIENEKVAVKRIVEDTYIAVLYVGEKKPEDLRQGFHQDFNMYVLRENNVLDKRSLDKWIARLIEVRGGNIRSKSKYRNTVEFAMIDVTGTTAMVKLFVYRDGELNFTDYLTLYKFNEGWRVMTKLFTWHGGK